jgi:indole-3-glycerol phosphate synthase
MNILDTIVEHKRIEVLKQKQKRPISSLSTFPSYRRKTNTIDLEAFDSRPGIIAEFKRKSPSKGLINMESDPVEVAGAYMDAGVAAMSILTDRDFFGGSFRDLRRVRESFPGLVLLRKDFIIDPYQLHQASAYGADMVLLIAAILEKNEVTDLALEARSLDLHVLLEVHNMEELKKYHHSIGYVGVNNRDLKTFRVDTNRSMELIGQMPAGAVPMSESGLSNKDEIKRLSKIGFRLFLMGETFMSQKEPGEACRRLIEEL